MNVWPPCADMLWMLTMVPPSLPRRISLAASCIRKNGARTLTANMWSNSSGDVSRMVPRSVIAAALTSTCSLPNVLSASAITWRQSSTRARLALTKCVGVPVAEISAATFSPCATLRPQITSPAAPSAANARAMASPRPWVPPVTTAIFPVKLCAIDPVSSAHAVQVPRGLRRGTGTAQGWAWAAVLRTNLDRAHSPRNTFVVFGQRRLTSA